LSGEERVGRETVEENVIPTKFEIAFCGQGGDPEGEVRRMLE